MVPASNRVKISGLKRKHAGTQESHAGTTMHGSLECLEPTDLSLGLPIAPSLGYGVTDSVEISLCRACEALERVDSGMIGFIEPLIEFATISAAKDPAKPHSKTPHGREFSEQRLQRVNRGSLARRQLLTCARSGGSRSYGSARCWWVSAGSHQLKIGLIFCRGARGRDA